MMLAYLLPCRFFVCALVGGVTNQLRTPHGGCLYTASLKARGCARRGCARRGLQLLTVVHGAGPAAWLPHFTSSAQFCSSSSFLQTATRFITSRRGVDTDQTSRDTLILSSNMLIVTRAVLIAPLACHLSQRTSTVILGGSAQRDFHAFHKSHDFLHIFSNLVPLVLLLFSTASSNIVVVTMRAGWPLALLCFSARVSSASSSLVVRTTAPVARRQLIRPAPTSTTTTATTALPLVQRQVSREDQGFATCGYVSANLCECRASIVDSMSNQKFRSSTRL